MATAQVTRELMPDWLASEMPPGYQTRLQEIQRLSADLKDMERFGQLLWRTGDGLAWSVGDVFAALGFEVERPQTADRPLVVKLPDRRRLLVHISSSAESIQRKSPELTHVFRHVNETADATDRVVLVANTTPSVRPPERPAPVGPEAVELLQRLGANILTGAALFSLWRLSLEDKERARKIAERLHAQDGGLFVVPTLAV